MENKGKISFFSAVLISINIMVGAGILYAVGPMTSSAGNISFLGWPIIGILLFPVIWGIANAAQLFPGGGGFYHYCATGINPMVGFIAQWGYLLGYMGTAASLSTVLRNGFINNAGVDFFLHYPFVFNIILVTFYTLINLLPLEKINKIQTTATILKISPILIVITLLAFYFNPSLSLNVSGLNHIGMTVSIVLFAYWGFEACCSLGGFLKDGPQKVASVILVGFFATMGLYTLFHIGLLYIMGPENLANLGAIAFPRFLGLSPTLSAAMEVGITGAVLFSWANSILGVSLGNITNIYNLSNNKIIIGDKLLGKVNKNQRPVYAAILHGMILLTFITFITDVNILFALTNFGVITAFVLTLVAIFLVHIKNKDYFKVCMTILAFLSCSALIYYTWIQIPNAIYILPLVVGMVLGIIMYKVQQSRQLQLIAAQE